MLTPFLFSRLDGPGLLDGIQVWWCGQSERMHQERSRHQRHQSRKWTVSLIMSIPYDVEPPPHNRIWQNSTGSNIVRQLIMSNFFKFDNLCLKLCLTFCLSVDFRWISRTLSPFAVFIQFFHTCQILMNWSNSAEINDGFIFMLSTERYRKPTRMHKVGFELKCGFRVPIPNPSPAPD